MPWHPLVPKHHPKENYMRHLYLAHLVHVQCVHQADAETAAAIAAYENNAVLALSQLKYRSTKCRIRVESNTNSWNKWQQNKNKYRPKNFRHAL